MSSPPLSATAAAPAATESFGVTDAQRDAAYDQWLQAGLQSGSSAMTQYQSKWSQSNLTAEAPTVAGTATVNITGNGELPNDGYSIQGQGQAETIDVLSIAANSFGSDAT